jgi:hypothetical protein
MVGKRNYRCEEEWTHKCLDDTLAVGWSKGPAIGNSHLGTQPLSQTGEESDPQSLMQPQTDNNGGLSGLFK